MIKKINNILILVTILTSLVFCEAFAVNLRKSNSNYNTFKANATHNRNAANNQATAQGATISIKATQYSNALKTKLDKLHRAKERNIKASINLRKKLDARANDFKNRLGDAHVLYRASSLEIDKKIEQEETEAKSKESLSQRLEIAKSNSKELADLLAEATAKFND